jgi:hypothetical protein
MITCALYVIWQHNRSKDVIRFQAVNQADLDVEDLTADIDMHHEVEESDFDLNGDHETEPLTRYH